MLRVLFAGVVAALTQCHATAQPLLEQHPASLTSMLSPVPARVQDTWPAALHRGVNLDGTLRSMPSFNWAIAANPFGQEWNEHNRHGSVRLDAGYYEIDEVDLAIPSKGIPWVIGRTYNPVQEIDEDVPHASNGYQGRNWFQNSQPELIFLGGGSPNDDLIYLVYGADRFLEFARVLDGEEEATDTFRGINGAAGAIVFEEDGEAADTFTYHDQMGNRTVFFGFDNDAYPATGQLWKLIDPAGNTAYVGHASSKSSAITNGYDVDGRVLLAYDATGHRFSYTYQSLDSVDRLTLVEAEEYTGSVWVEIGRVEYTYYESLDADIAHGSPGDLKIVTVKLPTHDSSRTQEWNSYYRYWKGEYDEENPGYPHQLRLVVGPEGTRRFDWSDPSESPAKTFDQGYLSASYSDLNPYAAAGLLSYEENTGRVTSAWFNGECGCAGGINGTYGYAYEDAGTDPRLTSGYQADWCTRTIVTPPVPTGEGAGVFLTQYFDEVGQPLSVVETWEDPTDPEDAWPQYVERDADGVLWRWYSTKNLEDDAPTVRYDHPTGAFTPDPDYGLVIEFERVSSGDLIGLPTARAWMEGDAALTSYNEWSVTYTSATKAVSADYDVTRPFVASKSAYTSTSPPTGVYTTDYTYTFHSSEAVLVPKSIMTEQPNVSVATNGPGGSARDTSYEYFRTDGLRAFTQAADGVLTYELWEDGLLSLRIDDANTSATEIDSADDPSGVWGIGSVTAGFSLVTDYSYDPQGRVTTTLLPEARTVLQYLTLLDDQRGVAITIPHWTSGTSTAKGPVGYLILDGENNTVMEGVIALDGGQTTDALSSWVQSNPMSPIDDPIAALDSGVGELASLSSTVYDLSGARKSEERTYFAIPGSGEGTDTNNYDVVLYDYDDMGRLFRRTDATGTITRSTFHPRGEARESWIGTDDGTSLTGNMGRVSMATGQRGISGTGGGGGGGSGGGGGGTGGAGESMSGFCYTIAEHITADPATELFRDLRGRVIVEKRPLPPHKYYERDNLGRITAIGLYDDVSELIDLDGDDRFIYEDPAYTPRTFNGTTSHRLALIEYKYDEQGRPYEEVRHKIGQVPGTDLGNDLDSLTWEAWRDATGRVVRDSREELVKHKYDRLSRRTHSFVLIKDADTSYAGAFDVSNDYVAVERQWAYEPESGNILMDVTISRFHDDDLRRGIGNETEGPLDLNADGGTPSLLKLSAADALGRVQITAYWYDDLERLVTTAQYGTNGGSTFDRSSASEPSSSSGGVLVVQHAYDFAGRLSSQTDQMGRTEVLEYDDAGNVIARIENYVDGTPGPDDEDRVTEYVFERGLMTQQIVKVPGESDQITKYFYGTEISGGPVGNELATGHLLSRVEYPDKDSMDATDAVFLYYDLKQRVKVMADQASNLLSFEHDYVGRLVKTTAEAGDASFDNTVSTVHRVYDNLGRISRVHQKEIGGAVIDEVEIAYDGWGSELSFEQDHDSLIGGSLLFDVDYSYEKAATSGARHAIRRTGMTLPDGTAVGYAYSEPTMDIEQAMLFFNNISRVRRVNIGSGGTAVARYDYVGADQLVQTQYPQPNIYLDKWSGVAGQYNVLDQFDRPIKAQWTRAGYPNIVDQTISYDYGSTPTLVVDGALSGNDSEYSYDSLDRLVEAKRGTWSGSAITGLTAQELWTLGQTGNWLGYQRDWDGNNDFTDPGDLDETAVFNEANEIVERDLFSDTSSVVEPAYDRVGNLVDDGEGRVFVYDVLGRLVRVEDGSSPPNIIAQYTYNGLGYLITAKYDTDNDGDVDDEVTERYIYDTRWRIVAVAVTDISGTTTAIKEQYVHHNAGYDGFGVASLMDAIILRDRDTGGSSDLDERVYYCQNHRGDVSALVDTAGYVLERVAYTPYGVPRVYPGVDGDWDGDGDVDQDDLDDYAALWLSDDPLADVDGNGTVEPEDLAYYYASWTNGWTASGGLSVVTDNRLGYAGYLWDRYARAYHVRHRVYEPSMGRWLNRDPIEYLSLDVNLYGYVSHSPMRWIDSFGLAQSPPHKNPDYEIIPGEEPSDFVERTKDLVRYPAFPSVIQKGPNLTVRDNLKQDNHDFDAKVDMAQNLADTGVKVGVCLIGAQCAVGGGAGAGAGGGMDDAIRSFPGRGKAPGGTAPKTPGGAKPPPATPQPAPSPGPAPSPPGGPATKGPPKAPQTFLPPSNSPRLPPTQGELPPGYTIRDMPPTKQYPDGYWRMYNDKGQCVDPSTMKPPSNVSKPEFQRRTHVPKPPK